MALNIVSVYPPRCVSAEKETTILSWEKKFVVPRHKKSKIQVSILDRSFWVMCALAGGTE